MTDTQIQKMLKAVIEEVDYDLYKSIFLKNCWEVEPPEAKARIASLVGLARKHIDKALKS